MLRIIIQEKNGGRQEVALDKDEISIGRVPANDLHLPKNNVSKKHAVIVRQGANWQLVDMRSTNGTFINGQQLQGSHVLQPNDQVIIGDFLLQFDLSAANDAMRPPPVPVGPPSMSPPSMPPPSMSPPSMSPMSPPSMSPMSPPSMSPMSPPSMSPMSPPSGPPPSMSPMGPPPGLGAPPSRPPAPPMGPPSMSPMSPPSMSPMSAPPGPPPSMPSMGPPPGLGAPPSRPPAPPMGPPGLGAPPSVSGDMGMRPPPPPGGGLGAAPPSLPNRPVAFDIGGRPRQSTLPINDIPPSPPPSKAPTSAQPSELASSGQPTAASKAFAPAFPEEKSTATQDEIDLVNQWERSQDDIATPAPPSAMEADVLTVDHDADVLEASSLRGNLQEPTEHQPDAAPMSVSQSPDVASPYAKGTLASQKATPAPQKATPVPPKATPPKRSASPSAPQKTAPKVAKAPKIAPKPAPVVFEGLSETHLALLQAAQIISQEAIAQMPSLQDFVMSSPALHEELHAILPNALDVARSNGLSDGTDDEGMLFDIVSRELLGFGALEELLDDLSVTAVMVSGHQQILVEKDGQISPSLRFFSSEEALARAILRLATLAGESTEARGVIETRLPDGIWFHAIFPPYARRGISLTLRKPRVERLSLDEALDEGFFSGDMAEVLKQAVERRCNILVSGPERDGRIALLNLLADAIPSSERIVSVESFGDLQFSQPNWVALVQHGGDLQGEGNVSKSVLLEQALRIRPQRLVLTEMASKEADILVPALVAGMDGVFSAIGASSLAQAQRRLAALLEAEGVRSPSKQIAEAFQLCVQIGTFADGSRRVLSLAEMTADEQGEPWLRELYRFESDSPASSDGQFVAVAEPSFL